MRRLSKLGMTLTLVFSILLLALVAEILYLMWRRRKLLRMNRTRIEPTGAVLATSLKQAEEIHRASRVLFTINEEERDELEAAEPETKTETTILSGELPEFSDFEAEPPFLTPSASPPYYTPTSSPGRETN